MDASELHFVKLSISLNKDRQMQLRRKGLKQGLTEYEKTELKQINLVLQQYSKMLEKIRKEQDEDYIENIFNEISIKRKRSSSKKSKDSDSDSDSESDRGLKRILKKHKVIKTPSTVKSHISYKSKSSKGSNVSTKKSSSAGKSVRSK
jgi:hypothetical protein